MCTLYRSLQVGEPIFVTFLLHVPAVLTTDPESVKVSVHAPSWLTCGVSMVVESSYNTVHDVQTIIMNPRHGKDIPTIKKFVNLMGERYGTYFQCLCPLINYKEWT